METQGLLQTVKSTLAEKEGIVYRKAETIIASILESSAGLKSLEDERNLSLFVVGNLYRLMEKGFIDSNRIEPLLILMHQFIGRVNFKLLNTTQIIPGLIKKIIGLLSTSSHSFLTSKYSLTVLTEVMLGLEHPQNEWAAFQALITISLTGSGFDRKDATKCLEQLLIKHYIVRKQAGDYVRQLVENNLEEGKETHLTNLSNIIKLFPMECANDIVYLLKRKLSDDEDASQRIQIYFLLDSVFQNNLATSSVSEEILKQLISNIPTDHQNERLLFGYVQALYENIIHLHTSNPIAAKRYISTCVSTMSEMLLFKDKVARQTQSLFKQMLSTCINNGLWSIVDDDLLRFSSMDLEDSAHLFTKVVCMMNDLLSSRYESVRKIVMNVLGGFAETLDEGAFEFVKPLITNLQNMRESLPEKMFLELFGKLISRVGYSNVIEMYPVAINGDPSNEQFDEANNLWLLRVIAKECHDGPISVFLKYFFPVISQCKVRAAAENILLKRNIFLTVIKRLWETLPALTTIDKKTRTDNLNLLMDEIEGSLDPSLAFFEAVARGIAALAPNLPKQSMSKKTEKLIPVLAKILDMDNPLSQSILKSISALSLGCDQEYLNRVFERNVLKLLGLKEKGQLSTNPDSHKNLEILIAISRGVNFNDSRVLSNNISKEECALKLITLLMNEDNTFQKKAYKYLTQAIEYMPEGFLNEAMSIFDSLSGSLLVYAKGYRVSLLRIIWYRLKFSDEDSNLEEVLQFVKKYLPEIIVSLRESNGKLRRVSLSLFNLIMDKMIQLNIMEHFAEMVCSGLASNSTSVKTDTVYALTLTLAKFDIDQSEKFIIELTEVLLVMLKQGKKEIYKAVLLYLKELCLHKLDKSKQLEMLPLALKALFEQDEDSRMQHRSILRYFLLKLTKRHTQLTITQMLPQEHRRLIRAIIRAENKLKKKKREKQRQYKLKKMNQAAQQSDYSSSEDELAEEPAVAMDEQIDQQEKERRQIAKKNNLLLKYDLHKEDFHFVENKRKRPEEKQHKNEQESRVTFEDGKIIFKEVVKRKREQNGEQGQEIQMEDVPRKRRKVIKLDTIHQIKESGSSFKAARAGGDVRIKNKPEPYAFIQLNSKALNKRYRHKAEKVFQSIFEKKEGGLKGLKTKLLSR